MTDIVERLLHVSVPIAAKQLCEDAAHEISRFRVSALEAHYPSLWVVFADNGNIRMFTHRASQAQHWIENGYKVTPYTTEPKKPEKSTFPAIPQSVDFP